MAKHNEVSSLQREDAKRQLLGIDNIANKGIAYDNKRGCAVAFNTDNWIEREGNKYVYYDSSLDLELKAEEVGIMHSFRTDEAIKIYSSPIIKRKTLPKNFRPTQRFEVDIQYFSEYILRLPIIYKTVLEDGTVTFKELYKVDKPKQEELIRGLSKYKEFTDFIGFTLSKFGRPNLDMMCQATFIENSKTGLLEDVLYTKFLKNSFENNKGITGPENGILKLDLSGYVIIVTDNEEDMIRHLKMIHGTFRERQNYENSILFQANYISNSLYIRPEKIEDAEISMHYISL